MVAIEVINILFHNFFNHFSEYSKSQLGNYFLERAQSIYGSNGEYGKFGMAVRGVKIENNLYKKTRKWIFARFTAAAHRIFSYRMNAIGRTDNVWLIFRCTCAGSPFEIYPLENSLVKKQLHVRNFSLFLTRTKYEMF